MTRRTKPRLARQIVVRIQRMIVEGHYPAGAGTACPARTRGDARREPPELARGDLDAPDARLSQGGARASDDRSGSRSGGGGGATWRFGARAGIAENLSTAPPPRRRRRPPRRACDRCGLRRRARGEPRTLRAAVVARDLLVTSNSTRPFTRSFSSGPKTGLYPRGASGGPCPRKMREKKPSAFPFCQTRKTAGRAWRSSEKIGSRG